MTNKRVQLIKISRDRWQEFKKGDIVSVTNKTAAILLKKGAGKKSIGVSCTPLPKKKTGK